MQNRRLVRRFAVILQLLLLSLISAQCFAQASYSIEPEFQTRIQGPLSSFTVTLTLTPNTVDIAGFNFMIAYNSSQAKLEHVSDNTGQLSAGVSYTMGTEQPFSGAPDVDVAVPVTMSTVFNLQSPEKLALLHFTTKPSYNDPQGRLWYYMGPHLDEGLVSGDLEPLPVSYVPLDQDSSVPDWTLY